jgi:hypothetical protein
MGMDVFGKLPASESPWVLVEGPAPGEAAFLGHWLLAAVDADRELEEQFKKNPNLKPQIARLEVVYHIRFSSAATKFIELLMGNLTCFSLNLWQDEEEWGQIFAVMADLGFFCLTGDRYQMTLPKEISGLKIEAALLRLAATEDEECYLHPEHLVTCLSKSDIENWQLRLERLPWLQRVADRDFLLGESDCRKRSS